MIRRFLFLIILGIFFLVGFLLGDHSAWSIEAVPSLLRDDQVLLEPIATDTKSQGIPQLKLSLGPLPVFEEKEEQGAPPYFILEGTFVQKDTRLLIQKRPIAIDETTGTIRLKVPLGAVRSKITVIAVNAYGQIQKQLFTVLFPGWKAYQVRMVPSSFPRNSFTFEVLGSQLHYQQTGLSSSFSQLGWVVKPSWTYRLGSSPEGRWDLGLNSYFVFFPFHSSLTSKTRPFGLNARVGYRTSWVPYPWALKVIVGWYYLTMFTQNQAFGFQNVSGPMIFPTLIRQLSGKKSAFIYVKGSPVSDRFSFQLGSYELATGGGFSMPLFKKQFLLFSANFSFLSLAFGEGSQAQSRTISIGIGINW